MEFMELNRFAMHGKVTTGSGRNDIAVVLASRLHAQLIAARVVIR